MFEANKDYNVKVAQAWFVQSSAKGTWGHEITYEDDGGESLTDTIWLTPKTIDGARKSYLAMGLTEDQISSPSFIKNPQDYVVGKECSIRTYCDEYKGKKRVKVQWVNPPKSEVAGNPADAAAEIARMFNKKAGKSEAKAAAPITSDDVPF